MSKPERVYPQWRTTSPIRIEPEIVRAAEALIHSCERCAPDDADIPIDSVLDSLTNCDPETTDYRLAKPIKCPSCGTSLRPAFWRWYESEEEGRKVFLLPGTLVVLKEN